MKKALYFALVALLALPLMFSCKQKNEPEEQETVYDPEKPDKGIGTNSWLDYWTEGEKEDAVPIDIKNLTGVWQLRAQGTRVMDQNHPDSVLSTVYEYDISMHDEEFFYYYEIKADLTDTLFVMRNFLYGTSAGVSTLEKIPGKWQVTGKKLTINRQRLPQGSMDETATAKEFTIYLLEKDRMVWQYETNTYAVFVRADKPKEPKTRKLTEVLTSKKWNISKDYQMTTGFKPSKDPTDASGGTNDTLYVNKNMWKDYQLEFKINGGDSILYVYNSLGTKVEEYAWHADSGDNFTCLHIDLKAKDNGKLFFVEMNMEWLDFKNYNKARMWSWEPTDKRSGYETCDMQRYFEIEGAK